MEETELIIVQDTKGRWTVDIAPLLTVLLESQMKGDADIMQLIRLLNEQVDNNFVITNNSLAELKRIIGSLSNRIDDIIQQADVYHKAQLNELNNAIVLINRKLHEFEYSQNHNDFLLKIVLGIALSGFATGAIAIAIQAF